MKDYKLKKDSDKTYLLDSNPTTAISYFKNTLPEKGEPWVQVEDVKEKK